MNGFAETMSGFGRWPVGHLWRMTAKVSVASVLALVIVGCFGLPTADDEMQKVLAAARHYDEALELYDRYRVEVGAGIKTKRSLEERARTPARIAVVVPLLKRAITRERAGLAEMKKALSATE